VGAPTLDGGLGSRNGVDAAFATLLGLLVNYLTSVVTDVTHCTACVRHIFPIYRRLCMFVVSVVAGGNATEQIRSEQNNVVSTCAARCVALRCACQQG